MTEKKSRIRLVTRGDDAASSRSANLAIREAFEKGILRNAGLMAMGPELEHAAETFRDLKGLCLGLHVTLNCEWSYPRWGPVLPADEVPSLVGEDGCLLPNPKDLHERQASVDEMMAEVEAQLQRVRETGLEIRYIDDHMGVGWVGGLEDRIVELAKREGLVPGDWCCDRLPKPSQPVEGGVVDQTIARLRGAQPGGTYLVVGHPCYDDEEMARFKLIGDPDRDHGRDRDAQRRMFLEAGVLKVCEEMGIEPIRYDEI